MKEFDTSRSEQENIKRREEQREAEKKRLDKERKQKELQKVSDRRRDQEKQEHLQYKSTIQPKSTDDAKKAQEMRERGSKGAYVNGSAIVNDYYHLRNAANRSTQSPAIQKYHQHQQAVRGKVQEKMKVQSQTQSQGRDR